GRPAGGRRPDRAAAPRARWRPAPRPPRTPRPPARCPAPAQASARGWPAAHRRDTGGRRLVASTPLLRRESPGAMPRPSGGQPPGGGYDGATMLEMLDRARLVVVTGKGGTGKTTVAAGLAVAAAGRGRRGLVGRGGGRTGWGGVFGG